MEVRRARGQRPTLTLSGRTAALGAAQGVRRLHVSLTHDGGLAVAQVLAEDGGEAPGATVSPVSS
jgi:holo-[acyl-carrier protein] synthase